MHEQQGKARREESGGAGGVKIEGGDSGLMVAKLQHCVAACRARISRIDPLGDKVQAQTDG